jgi:hypothetical protein
VTELSNALETATTPSSTFWGLASGGVRTSPRAAPPRTSKLALGCLGPRLHEHRVAGAGSVDGSLDRLPRVDGPRPGPGGDRRDEQTGEGEHENGCETSASRHVASLFCVTGGGLGPGLE